MANDCKNVDSIFVISITVSISQANNEHIDLDRTADRKAAITLTEALRRLRHCAELSYYYITFQ